MRKKLDNHFKLFRIITLTMICVMTYYIVLKFASLVATGDTRNVLIIETKQMLKKKIKNYLCNEIIVSDEYLSENRLISLYNIQNNHSIDNASDTIINNFMMDVVREKNKIADEIGNLVRKENERSIEQRESKNQDEDINIKDTKNVEEKLYNYQCNDMELYNNKKKISELLKKKDINYMLKNFFSVDRTTSIDKNMVNPKLLLNINNSIRKEKERPQILIYHTHASETYIDSRKNYKEDTVVGVGDYLTKILQVRYGYNVIHNRDAYDVVNKKWNRNAYDTALPNIKSIINKNPSIQVIIDLHRDSGRKKEVTNIDGINVARVMFFNGVSRSKVGNRSEIVNKNLKYNLSFSLAMEMEAMKMYNDFVKKIYIKGYRYNMHIAKKTMLIEVGNNKNTVREAKNAMILYAKILDKVLTTN